MLFDLRGSGRRRAVKIVYITLAFLMGGGLVLFGIGGNVSGGLVDAITGNSGGGGDGSDRFRKREEDLLARTRANPRDAAAWSQLARTRFQLAGQGENFDAAQNAFTASGRAKLRQATAAWERHVAVARKPDLRVASLMVQAYVELNQAGKAADAQELIANDRNTAGSYAQLATYAYAAGQSRKGDLAAKKALELADPDQRKTLKGQLDQAKNQGALPQSQQSGGG